MSYADATIYDFASGRDKHLAPEALFISALLDLGQFTPSVFGIKDQHVLGSKQVFAFCVRYQTEAHKAPELDLVQRKFPSFAYLPQVDPNWAASNLKEAWANRTLRSIMATATMELTGDDPDVKAAYTILKEGVQQVNPSTPRMGGVDDFDNLEEHINRVRCPVGLDGQSRLQNLTGGIAGGNLWYISARPGVGKTWKLAEAAVAAAEAGWNTHWFSMEMTRAEVADRIHQLALRHSYKGPWEALEMPARRQLMGEWMEQSGRIRIHGSEDGPVDTTLIAGTQEDDTLVVIDYIGLMRSSTGERAKKGWDIAAIISNELKETAGSNQIPIMSAAQINREGGAAKDGPRAEHVAMSDELFKDADVFVATGDTSLRTRINIMLKNRHGRTGARWYTRFEPEERRFEDITPEEAARLKLEDDIAVSATLQ